MKYTNAIINIEVLEVLFENDIPNTMIKLILKLTNFNVVDAKHKKIFQIYMFCEKILN